MKDKTKDKDFKAKVLYGLDLAYERLIQFKKDKKSELVILKNDKVVKISFDKL